MFATVSSRLVVVAALCVAAAPAALAQDLAPLNDRLQRLERSVNDLKAHVLGGRNLPQSETVAQTVPVATGDPAGLSLKLNALEGEVRSLTNRVEEVGFKLRRMESRLDQLVKDIDFRLSAIERNMSAPSAAAPAPSSDASQPFSSPSNSSGQQGAAPGPQILGQVTPQQLSRVPDIEPEPSQEETRTAAAPAAPTVPTEEGPGSLYDHAFNMLQAKRLAEAEQGFSTFLEKYPEHELAGNAQYWLGETYYVQQKYEDAASTFLDGYQKYRDSSKAPDNLLKLGVTLILLEQNQDACAVFAELADRYPNASDGIKRRAANERQKAGC